MQPMMDADLCHRKREHDHRAALALAVALVVEFRRRVGGTREPRPHCWKKLRHASMRLPEQEVQHVKELRRSPNHRMATRWFGLVAK